MKFIIRFLKEHWGFILILSALFFWAVYSYSSQGIVYSLFVSDSEAIINFVNSFGIFAGMIFVSLVIVEVVFAPAPPLVLYVAGGFLFGAFFGGVLVLFGNLIGALIDFKIARNLGRDFIEKKIPDKTIKKFDNFSAKYGFWTLFILRLNPFTSSDLFSYLSGLTNMKTRIFLAATGLGLIPLIFIQTYAGDFLIKNNPILSLILTIFSLLYFLIFLYLLFRMFKKRKH